MDDREWTEPAQPDRRRSGTWIPPAVTRRVLPVAVAVTAVGLLGILPVAGAAPAATGPVTAAQAGPVPGTDPAVQRWFRARDGLQIELNNALLPAQHLPRPAAAARPVCTRLLKAAGVLSALSRVPAASLQAPVRAGLDNFVQAATTCLAGDLPQAEQLVAQGLAARAAVSEQIDEILDGD